MNPNLMYSKTGAALTEQFESCKLTAYPDVKGVWTIGWGHTGPEVVEGLVWTQAQADAALFRDRGWAELVVHSYVTVDINQQEYDALVDFVFNVGSGNFRGSTLLKLLNAGDFHGAAAQFDLWDHAGGQVVAGLLRRRVAETQEFNS